MKVRLRVPEEHLQTANSERNGVWRSPQPQCSRQGGQIDDPMQRENTNGRGHHLPTTFQAQVASPARVSTCSMHFFKRPRKRDTENQTCSSPTVCLLVVRFGTTTRRLDASSARRLGSKQPAAVKSPLLYGSNGSEKQNRGIKGEWAVFKAVRQG